MARGRGTRGARGRGRGRGRKAARVISSDEEQQQEQKEAPVAQEEEQKEEKMEVEEVKEGEEKEKPAEEQKQQGAPSVVVVADENRPVVQQTFADMADISQLEAPTFTTLTRGPPEPMLRLEWNQRVSLIGEKVLNPMIYCCDLCEKPILVYGRMIPCKHVFCLKCARNETLKVCPRCKEKAIRVEQTGLGTIYMCTHGGTRYEHKGCRRTYLSQRDLQAHINHRHVSTPAVARLESLAVKINENETQTQKPLTSLAAATFTSSSSSSTLLKKSTDLRPIRPPRSNSQSESNVVQGSDQFFPNNPTTSSSTSWGAPAPVYTQRRSQESGFPYSSYSVIYFLLIFWKNYF